MRIRAAQSWLISCGLLIAAVASSTFANTIYDLGADWSNVSNPNGVWSYNQGTTPLTAQQFNWGGTDTNSLYWTTTPVGTLPPAWTQSVVPQSGAFDWQPGDVVVHSTNFDGNPADEANVTWTSPANGSISISGESWDALIAPGRDVSWFLYVGNTLYAQRASLFGVTRTDPTAPFDQNLLPTFSLNDISVAAGEQVMFEVASPNTFGHFAGVSMAIDYDAAMPLPTTAFAGALLLGLIVAARAFRSARRAI